VLGMGIGRVALTDMNRSHLPLAVSLIIILSSAPIAYAVFLTPVEIIGSAGDGDGNVFLNADHVATDLSGNVFVVGTSSNNAFKITPSGVITEIIDSTGDGGGNTLETSFGIATDSSGNVFVVGFDSRNAFKITTPGTCSTGGTVCTITEIIDATGDGGGNVYTGPRGVATDLSGNVFVVGLDSDNAFKITTPGTCSTGGTVCTITEIIDATGDGGGNVLSAPRNIATDSSGNVFVSGDFSDNAFKITPGGVITEIIDATGDGGANILDRPFGIATDSSGNVFVTAVTFGGIFKITPGGVITQISGFGGRSVATDSSDNVFFSSGNSLFKLELQVLVGGTSIPIDTTALLVAGFNVNSIWMIPTVLGLAGAGIAIFKLKRK